MVWEEVNALYGHPYYGMREGERGGGVKALYGPHYCVLRGGQGLLWTPFLWSEGRSRPYIDTLTVVLLEVKALYEHS